MPETGQAVSFLRSSEDLVVGFFGLFTSLLTSFVLWEIEINTGFTLYSWMFWFVIPVGALISGFAGASGYYAGSLLFGHRPSRLLLINILLASLVTFFLIHYLSYTALEVEGRRVSNFMPFWQYLDIAIRSTTMEFSYRNARIGSTGELGRLGYIVALIQIGGFAVGGFFVYNYLVSQPYCERCFRYLLAKGKNMRYASDSDQLQIPRILALFNAGSILSAVASHLGSGKASHHYDLYFRSVVTVRHCNKCSLHWVSFSVDKRNKNRWVKMPTFPVSCYTNEAISLDARDSPSNVTSSLSSEHASKAIQRVREIRCWSCKADIAVTPENRGTKANCPHCGKRQYLPE